MGGGDKGSEPHLKKSQMAIGFLKNSGMNPTREAIDPLGPTSSMNICEIR